MIVKDENPIIRRCLSSVKSLVDRWVIVDTGSTDGTREAIAECLDGIPGELHRRTWINFEHNRTEALRLAKSKGDYLLLIDADERLEGSLSPAFDCDAYSISVHLPDGSACQRPFLINNHLDWTYKGVLYEHLESLQQTSNAL